MQRGGCCGFQKKALKAKLLPWSNGVKSKMEFLFKIPNGRITLTHWKSAELNNKQVFFIFSITTTIRLCSSCSRDLIYVLWIKKKKEQLLKGNCYVETHKFPSQTNNFQHLFFKQSLEHDSFVSVIEFLGWHDLFSVWNVSISSARTTISTWGRHCETIHVWTRRAASVTEITMQ